MSAAQNRFKQARSCRPLRCGTQLFFVPSKPAQAGSEPRHSAPLGGRAATLCLGTCIVEARHWARSTVQLRARPLREPSAAGLSANVGALCVC
jgi:hypothetical protein